MNARSPVRGRVLAWLVVAAGLALFAVANAHLVMVATASQPECVAHERDGAGAAARSSCRPALEDR